MTLLKAIIVFVLVGLVLLVGRCSESGDSHYVDDIVSGANIFASTDMKPVHIDFVDPSIETGPVASVDIPRAFVIAFDPYTSKSYGGEPRHDALPYGLAGTGPLGLAYIHPRDIPYTLAPGKYSDKETGPVDDSFGRGYTALRKREQRRWLTGHARIFLLYSNFINDGFTTTRKLLRCPGGLFCRSMDLQSDPGSTYEGFSVYETKQGTGQYYVSGGNDEIMQIYCLGAAEKSHPQFFCDYLFPITDRLYVRLSFVDFRLHGGRSFAQARIRAFKQIFCGYLKCDDRALAAANLQ